MQQVLLTILCLACVGHGALVDLVQIEGKSTPCPEGFNKVSTKGNLNGDFDQGAGGRFILLCAKFNEDDQPITALTVIAESSPDAGCGDLSGEFHRIGQAPGVPPGQSSGDDGDFNHHAGGKFIYLCYKKEAGADPIVGLEMTDHTCDAGMVKISTDMDSNGDFNQRSGGKYIFLCDKHNGTAAAQTFAEAMHFTTGTSTMQQCLIVLGAIMSFAVGLAMVLKMFHVPSGAAGYSIMEDGCDTA